MSSKSFERGSIVFQSKQRYGTAAYHIDQDRYYYLKYITKNKYFNRIQLYFLSIKTSNA